MISKYLVDQNTINCEIMRDKNNRKYYKIIKLILNLESRRFGFVEIDEIYSLNSSDLLGTENPHYIDEKLVECKLAVPKDPLDKKLKIDEWKKKKRVKKFKSSTEIDDAGEINKTQQNFLSLLSEEFR